MSKPAVAIVHYHLRPGGVTRVIERAAEALGGRVDLVVLAGEPPAPESPIARQCAVVPCLGYADAPPPDLDRAMEALDDAARKVLGRPPDLWHVHNHALGKNAFQPLLAFRLAERGRPLLLQPHDFAEDGRPGNYALLRRRLGDALERILYPLAPHVRYAPINSRDRRLLASAGIPDVRILPNAVPPFPLPDRPISPEPTVVYPARAIRRKNLGEFLLQSLLDETGSRFVSTLAPQNPHWKKIYDEWTDFAAALRLPVEFDAGRKRDFPELVLAASAIATTSIAEGFGLAFLEPWLADKPLVGRNLPEITADFAQEGLDLSALYDALPVPVEWIGEGNVLSALETAMKSTFEAYAKPWTQQRFARAKEALITRGKIDFGRLDETMQRRVMLRVAKDDSARARLPTLRLPSPQAIPGNRHVVETRYGLSAYGERLFGLYEELLAAPAGPVRHGDAGSLLESFLLPERFNLLRT